MSIINKPRENLGEKPRSLPGSSLFRIPKAGGITMVPRSIQKPLLPKIQNGADKEENSQEAK